MKIILFLLLLLNLFLIAVYFNNYLDAAIENVFSGKLGSKIIFWIFLTISSIYSFLIYLSLLLRS